MFRGVLGVYSEYMVVYTCITGVHRCVYGNEWVYIKGIYNGYMAYDGALLTNIALLKRTPDKGAK